jgi:hypothetical protein
LGKCDDLDAPGDSKPQVENFELFCRMMERPEWENNLFGDISAILLYNRYHYCKRLLAKPHFHHRLVNGSDYPLPMLRFLNLTLPIQKAGMISKQERILLNEVYEFSPVLYDFCIKRTVKGPNGEQFPASLFKRNYKIF